MIPDRSFVACTERRLTRRSGLDGVNLLTCEWTYKAFLGVGWFARTQECLLGGTIAPWSAVFGDDTFCNLAEHLPFGLDHSILILTEKRTSTTCFPIFPPNRHVQCQEIHSRVVLNSMNIEAETIFSQLRPVLSRRRRQMRVRRAFSSLSIKMGSALCSHSSGQWPVVSKQAG